MVLGEEGGLRAKCLPPFSFFFDALYFDMQHDHVLRKSNFDLWTTSPGSGGDCGGGGKGGD